MKLQDLFEAKVNASIAMNKIISYISRKLEIDLIRIPGIEHFKNSKEEGFGCRFNIKGTTKCIRLNWESEPSAGSSTELKSIDLFTNSHDPSYNIVTKDISFAKSLPMIVTKLSSPKIGKDYMFPVAPAESLLESVLYEAKKEDFTSEQALQDFLNKLSSGKSFTRSEFIGTYHVVHVGIFDTIMSDFKDSFEIESKRISFKKGTSVIELKKNILTKAGLIITTSGGSNETYLPTAEEEKVKDPNHIPYSDVLEHLDGLITAVIKGAFSSLFITGKPGVGKTETVERVLKRNGLSDGRGYFKNTGTASAAGLYKLLYHHRNDILVFDDSDGVFKEADARNFIKAATDTKKSRKLTYSKNANFIFDPAEEDEEAYEGDFSMAPSYFNFTGKIIFISNLKVEQLDPDGALATRAFIINVNPTDSEILDQMEKILYDIKLEPGLSLSREDREYVLSVVKKSKSKNDLSLRKLVRALNLAASGAPNWEKLVLLYS